MAAWLLGVFVLVLLAGLALIRLGWRGRRINRDPVCRDCGFNLRAFRLPEMHGLPVPGVATSAAGDGASMNAEVTHSLTLGARQGGESPIGAASSPAVVSVTVTCPECGGGLKRAKAVRIGERKRSLILVVVGLMVVGLGVTPLGVASFFGVTGRDFSGYLPVGLLIFQSRHTTPETSRKIAAELEKRLLAKTTDLGQKRLIVDRALDIQADWSTPWAEGWGSVIEAARMSGAIESDQSKRWLANIAKFELIARKDIKPGDPLPVRMKIVEPRVASNGQAYVNARVREAWLGDANLLQPASAGARPLGWPASSSVALQILGSQRAQGGFRGGMANSFPGLYVPADTPPGVHKLRLVVSFEGHSGGVSMQAQSRELWCDVVVADSASAGVVAVEPTPELERSLRELLDCTKVRWNANLNYNVVNGKQIRDLDDIHWYLEYGRDWSFPSSAFPVGICMKVVGITSDGREIPLGSLSSEPWNLDDSASGSVGVRRSYVGVENPAELPLTIMLRPDLEGAKGSFTLRRVYNGELRFEVKDLAYLDSSTRQTYRTKQELLDALKVNAKE